MSEIEGHNEVVYVDHGVGGGADSGDVVNADHGARLAVELVDDIGVLLQQVVVVTEEVSAHLIRRSRRRRSHW